MENKTPQLCRPAPEDELEMLETVSSKPPCERAKRQFDNNGSRRSMNLSELISDKGHCVWCDGYLSGRRFRWCSDECVNAALFLSSPQKPGAKMHRLIHDQNFACAGCGLSFEDEIRKLIRRYWEKENAIGALYWGPGLEQFKMTPESPEQKITYHQIGDNTGHKHQTDHIIPVHKGGAGIDPKNLQVLCVPCHKRKTKEDHSRGKECQLILIE